ncbi:GUN4 domain-containing protein [Planktothrix paucivesiculata]|uniref:GUN4 domain protein n=1 Tax=Planktothrix paucivesiculata PCC 9631 TaxID=671071 RepID=A0A7Z9BIS8_9CYAN|nr:GUN4 domain-containing protein [Planktothrix paucivesiculata]VXD10466.1 GUN4 domain protein [Planktothrix paucivesiculata PCC 9631]
MSDQQRSQDSEKNLPASGEVEATKARKIVQGFTQTLLQLMPIGGSGFAFVSFLLQREWLQALLMFPVMVVTGVWAAYTESFLTRLREVYQERGRKDVDSLMGWLESADQTIQWQLAGTEDKYLRCQGSACCEYRTEGYSRGSFVPLLSDVFVPLELSGDFLRVISGEELPMPAGFRREDSELIQGSAPNELTIWDLLAKVKQYPVYSRMAILAWGGYGKTTLLKHITSTYAERRHRQYKAPEFLPVLLPLRKWQKVIATEQNLDLPSLIEKHHIPSLPEGTNLKLPPQWAKKQLKDGKMLVMFDGFDEVKPEWRRPVSTWLDKQMTDYQKAVFILTSRPAGYKDYIAANPPSCKLFVKPFNANQRERFVRQWYFAQERCARPGSKIPEVKRIADNNAANLLEQLHQRPELEILAKNPLLLNIMANLHRSYAGQQLPQQRSELYQDIFTLQLKDRPRYRGIDMLVPFPESQQVLQKLALALVVQNQPNVERQALETQISTHLQSLDFPNVAPSDFLNQIVDVSELIVKHDENYEFAHLSFQGYLAAAEIKTKKQEELLLNHWQNSWWKETILLYCAQVNPTNLIRKLLKIGNQEAVKLADECLKESLIKVDLTIETTLQKQRYQQLENYLKNKQWKEADQETYRMMLQTVRKEEGQWLDPEDLENLPCEDLRTINQLWLDYSNGKFGFSVQKEIYQSLGGTRKYNQGLWFKFGDRVGWRVKGKWLYYEDLTYDREAAPVGHFPLLVAFVGSEESVGGGGRWRLSLLSRKDL